MHHTDITTNLPLREIDDFCKQYPIRKLSLFGSILHEEFNEASDIDVLVEFVPNAGVTYFDLFDMQEALTTILGRQVDLLTPSALSPYFRDDVCNEALTIYERQ